MQTKNSMHQPLAGLLPCALALSLPFAAQAQNAPTREEVQAPDVTAAPRPSTVTVDGNQAVSPDPDCPLTQYSDVTVSIRSIVFEAPAGGVIPAEIERALAPVAADVPPAGQQVAIVCTIRDRATEALRQGGYIASVQIPPQRIEDGVLRLQVVTAHIVEVRVRGDVGPYRDTLAARIEKLKALNPLNERDAERILLLADDIPGVDVHLALRPAGGAPGAVIGELTVTRSRARAIFNAQNYGSRQLGRESIYGRAEVYGITGASDLTYLGAQTTVDFEEQYVVQGGHIFGIGSGGTTVSLAATHAWSRPDVGILDLRARSLIAALEVSSPLVRSVRTNVQVAGGFEYAEQRTRVHFNGGSNSLNRDRIRTLYLRLSGSTRDLRADGTEPYLVSGSVEVRKGLNILNATAPRSFEDGYTPSRFEGDSQAWIVRGEARAAVSFGPVQLRTEAQGQWADRPLLNLDEFSIGNLSIGRGYDPGANSGDRAVGVRGEVVFNIVNKPAVFDLFAFKDQVWLWNLDTGATENGRSLGSFGGGARILLPRLAVLEATYARPEDPALLLPGAKKAPERFLLSLTVQFAPKSR